MEFQCYHVIEFLVPPCANIQRYVCVPEPWIRFPQGGNIKFAVSYPDEDARVTDIRVRRYQNFKEEWAMHTAFVRHSTDSYEEAIDFIERQNDIDDEIHTHRLQDLTFLREHTRPPISERSSPQEYDIPSQTKRYKLGTTLPCTNLLNRSSPPVQNYQSVNSIGGRINLQSNSANNPSTIGTDENSNHSTNLMPVFRPNTNSMTISEELTAFASMQQKLIQQELSAINKTSNEEVNNLGREIALTPESESSSGVHNIIEDDEDVIYIDDDEYDSENTTTADLNYPYNTIDTKWTLKYKKHALGLMELSPLSNIYVDAKSFTECLKNSKNCRALARNLLVEVFNENALKICSLTGDRRNKIGSAVRPGLDEKAINAVITCVKELGRTYNWPKADRESIKSSMKYKLKRHQKEN